MSCRQARSALQQRGDELEERDLFKKPLTRAELGDLAGQAGGVGELFSWKSPTARKMGLQRGGLDDDRLLDLMAENPQLIRRPVIIRDGRMQLGFGSKQGLTV